MPDFGAEAAKGGPVVDVSILPTGWLYLPDTWIFQDGKPGFKHWSPDFSFLVRHPSGRTIIFDLGMRKVIVLAFNNTDSSQFLSNSTSL
jgi:hypothetical protein